MTNTILNNCTGAVEYGNVIYLSHLVPIGISLVLISFLLRKQIISLTSLVFSIFVLNFCLWLGLDTITWISTNYYLIISSWIPLDLIDLGFYIFGLYFFLILVTGKDISLGLKILLFITILPLWLLIITGNSIVTFDENTCEVINNRILMVYKLIVEISIILFIIKNTVNTLNNGVDQYKKRQILVVSLALISFLLIFSITEFISSETGIYEINLYSLFVLPISLFIIIFAITSLDIFKVRIISTQLLTYIIITIVGLHIFIQPRNVGDVILGLIIFLVLTCFGMLLIRIIRREEVHLSQISSLAAELKSLNSTLSDKVTEQTQEITRAYELEKKAKRDLEKLNSTKDQFIMITQHNLRVPVTNIKNKFSTILKDQESKLDEQTRKTLEGTEVSIENLRHIADDLLNITKLKPGSHILNLSVSNPKALIENVLNELNLDIKNLNIKVTYPTDKDSWPNIKMDSNKIKEVFLVIIENAIRYNKKDGTIKISTQNSENNFKIIIENTGVGITDKEKENISNRSFYRSERARSLNPTGMGVGLSVSKSIVDAHHGTLNIDSAGENMGAKVTLTLPFDFLKTLNLA